MLPIGVNTELYSGVKQARGFKTPEPEDVAAAIVDLLQTGRFEQYVPKYMAAVVRMNALMPRRSPRRSRGSPTGIAPADRRP